MPPNPTVAEVAEREGKDPVELMIDLALDSDFEQFFVQVIANRNPDDLYEIMTHPRTVMTFSDSGAHVSQIMDSSIQTHLLAHWVRDRQALTLEQAVRMLTLEPSTAWGFADRGLVREGLVADLNVFDPATVGPDLPTVETDLPAGARRLKQTSTGFLATVVGRRGAAARGQAHRRPARSAAAGPAGPLSAPAVRPPGSRTAMGFGGAAPDVFLSRRAGSRGP